MSGSVQFEALPPGEPVCSAIPAARLPYSGLGIASFVTALTGGVGTFVVFVVAGALTAIHHGELDETGPEAIVIGLCLFAMVALLLVALGLGIAGLVQRGRRKAFAIAGVVVSLAVLLGAAGLVALGVLLG